MPFGFAVTARAGGRGRAGYFATDDAGRGILCRPVMPALGAAPGDIDDDDVDVEDDDDVSTAQKSWPERKMVAWFNPKKPPHCWKRRLAGARCPGSKSSLVSLAGQWQLDDVRIRKFLRQSCPLPWAGCTASPPLPKAEVLSFQ